MTLKKIAAEIKWDVRYTLCIALVFVMLMMTGFISSKHVIISADGQQIEVNTPYKTPANILNQAGITALDSDEYVVSENDNGEIVLTVKRAVEVAITYQGTETKLITTKSTVGEVLEGYGYVGNNYQINLNQEAPIEAGMNIVVTEVPVAPVVPVEEKKTVNTNHGEMTYETHLTMEASAYLPSDGNGAGITATGIRATHGVVAVDPRVIPLGTKVYIPGYGVAVAADTGGAIRGHKIDLCMESYGDAISFGRRDIDVYVLS